MWPVIGGCFIDLNSLVGQKQRVDSGIFEIVSFSEPATCRDQCMESSQRRMATLGGLTPVNRAVAGKRVPGAPESGGSNEPRNTEANRFCHEPK